ncbi:hypothetical protein O6H91_20G057900 [Diphasiastrum complanatum]|uniref:Uncharacterized protein n=1 Tax=Diphasiastrum complanatum TaxID=34168 RepID=A0ACC2AQL9_DIPCM|nr:hypothetical protein O6H91_20G057900 [Diphasiastrum complanatum]
METPASMRRITRSQAKQAPKPSASKLPTNRRALKDLTNESPVSGLADSVSDATTPCAKHCLQSEPTKDAAPAPASNGTPVGEDVLRSQVQSLLEKISADRLTPLPPVMKHLSQITGFVPSPSSLLAPTPANTPAGWPSTATEPIANSCDTLPISIAVQENLQVKSLSSIQEGSLLPSDEQARAGSIPVSKSLRQSNYERKADDQIAPLSEEPVGRSLLFESPMSVPVSANNEVSSPKPSISSPKQSCSSSLQFHQVRELEDDEASNWSLMVNVSSPQDAKYTLAEAKPTSCDEELNPALWEQRSNNSSVYEETADEKYSSDDDKNNQEYDNYSSCDSKGYEEDEEEEEAEEDEALCDELCYGVGNMNIKEGKGELRGLPPFSGKHIRFNYNSDDEMEGEVVTSSNSAGELRSPGVVKLKGLPTPRGKHLRFKENATPSKN